MVCATCNTLSLKKMIQNDWPKTDQEIRNDDISKSHSVKCPVNFVFYCLNTENCDFFIYVHFLSICIFFIPKREANLQPTTPIMQWKKIRMKSTLNLDVMAVKPGIGRIVEWDVLLENLRYCKKCGLGPVPLTYHSVKG